MKVQNLLANLAVIGYAKAFTLQPKTSTPTLYSLDNSPAGASIVSVSILPDGSFSQPLRVSTGGKGSHVGSLDGNAPGPDTLFTQNSVVVGDKFLLSVNPSSNTLSLFNLDPNNPTHPTLAGNPADTLGEFPASVAYSSKLKQACVLNGGSKGGVSCFAVSSNGLKPLDKTVRSVSPALNQTTPPLSIDQTASDVFFNPPSIALFAIIKGNAQTGLPPTIFAWPVVDGKVAATPITSQSSTLTYPFGATFINNNQLWLADVAFGASQLTVGPDFRVHETAHVPIAGEMALCWATFVSSLGNVYFTDGHKTEVSILDAATGSHHTFFDFPTSDVGGFDNVEYQKKPA